MATSPCIFPPPSTLRSHSPPSYCIVPTPRAIREARRGAGCLSVWVSLLRRYWLRGGVSSSTRQSSSLGRSVPKNTQNVVIIRRSLDFACAGLCDGERRRERNGERRPQHGAKSCWFGLGATNQLSDSSFPRNLTFHRKPVKSI